MTIKILFFATLRDQVGARTLEMDVPAGTTVADLRTMLAGQFPKLAAYKSSVMAAVNREYAADEQVLSPNAEIALFPPVSGG